MIAMLKYTTRELNIPRVVREQFYLPQGRRAIRRTLAKCEPCKLQRSLPKPPRMANLPRERH
jgi:hypothetical protein